MEDGGFCRNAMARVPVRNDSADYWIKKMRELKLKAFAYVDFRKSEKTNFEEFINSDPSAKLRKGETVLFINQANDQYVFVEAADEFHEFDAKGSRVNVKVLASQRFRISGTKWDPMMLSKYAERAGISIVGIKRFEWYMKQHLLELRDAA